MKKALEDLKRLMKDHQGMVQELNKIKERNIEELKKDRITETVADERIQKHLDESNFILERRSKEVSETLEEEKEKALKQAMDFLTTSLTVDEVAELQLLNQLKTVTNDDLDRYAQKYDKKPLALKYIDSIAQEKEMFFTLSEEQQDQLNPEKAIEELAQDIETEIRQYNSIREVDEVEALRYELVTEGKIENVQKEIDNLK
jgi:hypothetical protein